MKGEIDSDIKGAEGRVSLERFAALSVEHSDVSLNRREKERGGRGEESVAVCHQYKVSYF